VVVREVADVAIGRVRPRLDDAAEPLKGRGDPVESDRGVGVVGMGVHEGRQRFGRTRNALGVVAEDVHQAGRKVRGPDSLGEHADARAGLGKAGGGGEPRDARSDHDHVEMPARLHDGR
jgi:hypothetical protein